MPPMGSETLLDSPPCDPPKDRNQNHQQNDGYGAGWCKGPQDWKRTSDALRNILWHGGEESF